MNAIKIFSLLLIFCIGLAPGYEIGYHLENHQRSHFKGLYQSYEDYKNQQFSSTKPSSGKLAEIIDFPWTVSLQIASEHKCNGVILNKRHILTDAYCVLNVRLTSLMLRAGYSDNKVNGQLVFAKSIHIHPNYNVTNYLDFSLAVVELKTKLNYSNLIQPINLSKLNFTKFNMIRENSTVFVAGWEPQIAPRTLLKQNIVRIISNRKCQSYYRGNINYLNLFCAEVETGLDEITIGSCQTNVGGPIIKYHGKHKIIIGIVVWGHGCDSPLRPGVYVRIQPHLEWLNTFK